MSNLLMTNVSRAVFPAKTDLLHPRSSLFSLGRPFGLLPTPTDEGPSVVLPFGLRRAVASTVVPIGDLSAYGYDHKRQIGVVREGSTSVPLLRHTTGQTRTTTNPDGHGGLDSDSDHRED